MYWLFWIAVALVAVAGEAFTTALILASFAVAALIVSPLSLGMPLPFQIVVFAVLSLLLVLAVRPVALGVLNWGANGHGPEYRGIVGRQAIAVNRIDLGGGQVRIGQSEFWTARPIEGDAIPAGSSVEVVRVEGLTAFVRPTEVTMAARLPPSDHAAGLSSREIEVLRLVAQGKTNAEIASVLVISARTVDHHVSHILDKFGATSRVDAVRLAIEQGVIDASKP